MSWLNTILNAIVNVISSIIKIRKSDRIIKPQIIPRKIFCFYGCLFLLLRLHIQALRAQCDISRHFGLNPEGSVCQRKPAVLTCVPLSDSNSKSSRKHVKWKSEPTSNTHGAFFKWNGKDLLVNLEAHVRVDEMWCIWCKTVLTGAEKSRPLVQTCGLVTTKHSKRSTCCFF